jgi:hypothetical protein
MRREKGEKGRERDRERETEGVVQMDPMQ